MIYNAIVAANLSPPLKLSENAHYWVANDRGWYFISIRYVWEAADAELLCLLTKSIDCLPFVWTFLLKSRSLFRRVPGLFQAIGSLSAPLDGWGWIIKRMTSNQKYN